MNESSRIVVSVVVPVFNAEPFIPVSVGSALAQSLESVEVICVDDGSTDRSVAALHALAGRDERLRVVELGRNRGASAARNVGIDHARGEFVSFLDADDSLPPGGLARLVAAASASDSDLAMGALDWRVRADQPEPDPPSDAGIVLTTAAESDYLQGIPGNHCCNLYRRRLLERHGLRYEPDLSFGEDQLFQAKAIVLANRVAIIKDIVYTYHHYRSDSVTKKAPTLKNLLDDIEFNRRIARLFMAHGLVAAGHRALKAWSYSIRNYWWRIPTCLTKAEAFALFASFRAMVEEFGVEPWNPATPAPHRHLLGLIVARCDQDAFENLETDEVRTGRPAASTLAGKA
jgi:glycosyltransferase involved in cell wall biosynthesis